MTMRLSRKISVAFGIVTIVTIGTLLVGVPYVLSEVSMRQMDSHAQTFGTFLGSNLESLADHEPGLFRDESRRDELKTMVQIEFNKAAAISKKSRSFSVLSMDLLGPDRKEIVIWGDTARVAGSQDLDSAELPLSQEKVVLRQDVMKDAVVPQVEELLVPLAFKESSRWVVRVHFDFQKSTELHQDQYLTFQIGSILVLLAILTTLLFVLLRFLRATIVRPATALSVAMASVASGRLDIHLDQVGKDEFGVINGHFNAMVQGLQERQTLGQYVSHSTRQAVQRAILSGQSFHKPERRDAVIFFSDIRGFTSFSEKNDPEIVLRMLNRILDLQASVIARFGGDIDKFIGDETMAVFHNTEAAFLAALTIQVLMRKQASELAELTLGIGLCDGPVVQGDVGIESMRDFTVIGDTVNTASRLQSLARGGEILVPRASLSETLLSRFRVQSRGPLLVKGKEHPLEVVSLVGTMKRAAEEAKEVPCLATVDGE